MVHGSVVHDIGVSSSFIALLAELLAICLSILLRNFIWIGLLKL